MRAPPDAGLGRPVVRQEPARYPVLMVDGAMVQALLSEIRSWEPGSEKTVQELSRLFGLEPHVIQRIAKSEGLTLRIGDVAGGSDVNERADTAPMEVIPWDPSPDE